MRLKESTISFEKGFKEKLEKLRTCALKKDSSARIPRYLFTCILLHFIIFLFLKKKVLGYSRDLDVIPNRRGFPCLVEALRIVIRPVGLRLIIWPIAGGLRKFSTFLSGGTLFPGFEGLILIPYVRSEYIRGPYLLPINFVYIQVGLILQYFGRNVKCSSYHDFSAVRPTLNSGSETCWKLEKNCTL